MNCNEAVVLAGTSYSV